MELTDKEIVLSHKKLQENLSKQTDELGNLHYGFGLAD